MRDIRTLFPTDDPVAPERLVGRRQDVERIATMLGSGQSVVLAGPRRTGKTSVAHAALARVAADGGYVAAVDLFRRRDTADLAQGIAAAVLANRPAGHRLLRRVRDLAGAARDAATLTASARLSSEFGEAVEIALSPARASADPGRSLAAALELAQRVAAADDRRFVLFLDEFQDLASDARPFGDPDRLTKQMRAIFQTSPNVAVLFAGSVEHLMRDLFGPADRALSQFGSFRALSPISAEEWEDGLTSRFAEIDLVCRGRAIDRLLDRSGGHPRATMLIAVETATQAMADGEGTVTSDNVDAGVELAMASDRLRHEQILERLKGTRHAVHVATRIARAQSPYSGLPSSGAHRAVRALQLAGLIESPRARRWKVGDPLLRAFLAELPGA